MGAKHIKRIEIPISKGICDCRVFRADYLFMAPLEVYITFVDSSGVRVRGKSMIYKKTSKKVRKLKGKTKYYIRIRTFKTIKGVKYYSPWSGIKTVRIR